MMLRILIFLCLLLSSCALPKFSSIYPEKRNQIDTLCILSPVVNYIFIDSKNSFYRNDSINDSISKTIEVFIYDKIEKFDSYKTKYSIRLDTNQNMVLGKYCDYLEKGWRRQFTNYQIPKKLKNLTDSIPYRYILIPYLEGYELSKRFYMRRLVGDVAFSFLTMGTVLRSTYSSRYRMNLFLIDNEMNQLIFYNNNRVDSECTPYNYRCMENSIYQCFYKFY